MNEQRVRVWVQRFYDRPTLILQWVNPDTGQRRSKSARTTDCEMAEIARRDLEYEAESRDLPRVKQAGMGAIPRTF